MKKRAKEGSLKFKKTSVSGVITDYFSGSGGTRIKVDNHTKEFYFVYDPSTPSPSLSLVVDIGDSLIKESNSIIFTIKKKDDKSYKYQINPRVIAN